MNTFSNRRGFLKKAIIGSGAVISCSKLHAFANYQSNYIRPLKIALNTYSFNQPLTDGTMNLEGVLDFCAENGFHACDATAYYFPGYPEVPEDDYLYHIKHKAFSLGLEICGTGIRNDFTNPDHKQRNEHIELINNWIIAAKKLGAPVIRVFAGPKLKDESIRTEVLQWMIKDLKQCVAFGKSHGVIVAIQNHHDFIMTPRHTQELMEAIDSDWFGLVMDTGGYRSGDPYQQIAESIDYAVNWQIKEKIFINGVEHDTDIEKLVKVIQASNYRGYLPIETLGPGDPKPKILKLQRQLEDALA